MARAQMKRSHLELFASRLWCPHFLITRHLVKHLWQLGCSTLLMAQGDSRGENYEEQHVHTVYEQIASHFSSTRYKVRCCSNITMTTGTDDS